MTSPGYRIFYRTAQAFNAEGNPVGEPGPWVTGPVVDPLSRPATFTINFEDESKSEAERTRLQNGVAYDFVVGAVANGSFSNRSNIARATPVAASDTYNTIGPQTVAGVGTFDRQATMTTLTLSNASWVHVYLDWGSRSAGVARGNKSLPSAYPAAPDVIRKKDNSNTVVEILLSSSTAFTFTVYSNNASITVSLAVVASAD